MVVICREEGNIVVQYKKLGYKTFEEYFSNFINTLLPTNKTYEYFVDWEKVRDAVLKYEKELALLGQLHELNPKKAKEQLELLLQEHPTILPLIPALIAERTDKGLLSIYDPDKMQFVEFNFKSHFLTESEINQIVEFCEKTGLLDVLISVQNLRDYLFGVEVGIDTNSRKGRSGTLFEKMVKRSLEENLPGYVRVISQDRKFSLYETIGRTKQEKAKRHDFVLYKEGTPIMAIEVNFYNVTGSKPIEIVGSYITLNRAAKEKGITFAWVTDGPAWRKMKEPLMRGMKEIEWVVNYFQLQKLIQYFNSINWEI